MLIVRTPDGKPGFKRARKLWTLAALVVAVSAAIGYWSLDNFKQAAAPPPSGWTPTANLPLDPAARPPNRTPRFFDSALNFVRGSLSPAETASAEAESPEDADFVAELKGLYAILASKRANQRTAAAAKPAAPPPPPSLAAQPKSPTRNRLERLAGPKTASGIQGARPVAVSRDGKPAPRALSSGRPAAVRKPLVSVRFAPETQAKIVAHLRRGSKFLPACRKAGASPECQQAGRECMASWECGSRLAGALGVTLQAGEGLNLVSGGAMLAGSRHAFAGGGAGVSGGGSGGRMPGAGPARAREHGVEKLGTVNEAGTAVNASAYFASMFASMNSADRATLTSVYNDQCFNRNMCDPAQACAAANLYSQCLVACNANPRCRGSMPSVAPTASPATTAAASAPGPVTSVPGPTTAAAGNTGPNIAPLSGSGTGTGTAPGVATAAAQPIQPATGGSGDTGGDGGSGGDDGGSGGEDGGNGGNDEGSGNGGSQETQTSGINPGSNSNGGTTTTQTEITGGGTQNTPPGNGGNNTVAGGNPGPTSTETTPETTASNEPPDMSGMYCMLGLDYFCDHKVSDYVPEPTTPADNGQTQPEPTSQTPATSEETLPTAAEPIPAAEETYTPPEEPYTPPAEPDPPPADTGPTNESEY